MDRSNPICNGRLWEVRMAVDQFWPSKQGELWWIWQAQHCGCSVINLRIEVKVRVKQNRWFCINMASAILHKIKWNVNNQFWGVRSFFCDTPKWSLLGKPSFGHVVSSTSTLHSNQIKSTLWISYHAGRTMILHQPKKPSVFHVQNTLWIEDASRHWHHCVQAYMCIHIYVLKKYIDR